MKDRIKVTGYSKKSLNYGNGIEYRDFSPDLVGQQLTSNGGTSLFTMGNFSITTNMDPTIQKKQLTNKFSDFYSLDELGIEEYQGQNLNIGINNLKTPLNLDRRNIGNYSLFGSLKEFIRVNLENIITVWPASLWITQFYVDTNGVSLSLPTFNGYVYDITTNTSSFKVNTNLINNKFDINYLKNGNNDNTFNEGNNLRNLTTSYQSYVILLNGVEYRVIDFLGSDNLLDDYITLKVEGNVFKNISNKVSFHIKPSKINEEIFFKVLNDFSGYLLNRQSYPKYKSNFKSPKISDSGVVIVMDEVLIWPVTDGYNIDFDTIEYFNYVDKLLTLSEESDLLRTNLMNRFLVSDSISDFDTNPIFLDEAHQDTSGQKINKTLQIYGVNFDEINNYISGIGLANVVTYNKEGNTPDKYLKNLASILGWDLINSVTDNNLINNFVKTNNSSFDGESNGLTSAQMDIEFWRRIILNTPWIWKSKGTRKTIEFLLNFLGTPSGLVDFNEYVYLVDKPIDVDLFRKILLMNNLDDDLTNYPIDYEGYPRFFNNNDSSYFQNDGLWYRETSGENALIDILDGNNPHVGPYDNGSKYINQLNNLIPNFKPVLITGETKTVTNDNLFFNYNLGEMLNYSGDTYVDVVNEDGSDLTSCIVVKTEIVVDPIPAPLNDECGCPQDYVDEAISICVKKTKPNVTPKPCSDIAIRPFKDPKTGLYLFEFPQYNRDGSLFKEKGVVINRKSNFIDRECCKTLGGTPMYTELNNNYIGDNAGYVCCTTKKCGCFLTCDWVLTQKPYVSEKPTNGQYDMFMIFELPNGENKMIMPDSSSCPSGWGIPVEGFTDPFNGEVGTACKLTYHASSNYSITVSNYLKRATSGDCCNFKWPLLRTNS